MSSRKSNPPPPPPREGGASTGTATTAPSTGASPYYYSLSEIDDDSTAAAPTNKYLNTNNSTSYEGVGEDDTTEIDDNDSILEMAKRLDAASVISDPTIIEGPHNNTNYNDGQHPSWGANRMDDIASEESASSSSGSDDSSSDDSSSSSDGDYHNHHRERYEYNNNQHHGRSRHREGRRRQNHPNSSRNHHPDEGLRSHHHHHDRGNNKGRSSDRRRMREHRQRNNNPRQQQQQQSSSMPSQPYYDNCYDSRGHQQQKHNMSYPGGGGGERKYSPPRGGATGTVPIIDPIMYTSGMPNNNKQSRGGYREDPTNNNNKRSSSNNNSSKHSYENRAEAEAYEKKQSRERYYDRGDATESAKRRRTKMILIPSIVILIIGVVVAIAVVVGKGNNNGDENTQNYQDPFDAFRPIPVPTTSPTYFGLYQCKIGEDGPTVTKGCLGFIECSKSGTAMGPIQYCPTGTLYDVRKGVCDFAANVDCSTTLPTQEELAVGNTPPTAATPPTSSSSGGVSWIPPSAPAPQNPSVVPVPAPPQQKPPSITVGPITTSNHKLLFEGVINPGQLDNNAMNRIAKNLEVYLNNFFSARVINAYSNGDYVLESIGNVTIGVVASKFEFVQNSNRRHRNLLLRRDLQQTNAANGFAMTYNQTTKYDTIDSAITVDTIVRRPYQERYQDRIVSYLKAADPGIFSSLARASFVEGDVGGQPAPPQQQPVSVPAPISSPSPTRKPTIAPTKQGTSPPVSKTNPPTKAPVTSPPVAATVPNSSATYTIQGFMFFDENQNGIFEYANEEPFAGVFANLRLCTPKEDGIDYVKSEISADGTGLYQFRDVKENEYFVEFSKPSPGDDYDYTIKQVAGNDASALDSDVDEIGKTDCFTVGPGFDSNKFINAGFKLKPTPPPSPAPSKSPTIDAPLYCADPKTSSTGELKLDFFGCVLPCGNDVECPGNLLCARADECIEPV